MGKIKHRFQTDLRHARSGPGYLGSDYFLWAMVTVAQANLQRKRTATMNLSFMQEGKCAIALAQEPYIHKGDFYC